MRHRAAIRYKHLQPDQAKLTRVKTVLSAKTETDAIEGALVLVVEEHTLDQPLRRAKERMQLQKGVR